MTQANEHLSDRMPAVLDGRDVWQPADLQHLAGCDECEAELALLVHVRRLGDEAPMLDAARITAAVLPRVAMARKAERTRRFTIWSSLSLAAAAVIALAVAPALRGPAPVPAPAMIAELDDLDTEALRRVLAAVDAGLPKSELVDDGSLSGLDESDLDALLNGLGG